MYTMYTTYITFVSVDNKNLITYSRKVSKRRLANTEMKIDAANLSNTWIEKAVTRHKFSRHG